MKSHEITSVQGGKERAAKTEKGGKPWCPEARWGEIFVVECGRFPPMPLAEGPWKSCSSVESERWPSVNRGGGRGKAQPIRLVEGGDLLCLLQNCSRHHAWTVKSEARLPEFSRHLVIGCMDRCMVRKVAPLILTSLVL